MTMAHTNNYCNQPKLFAYQPGNTLPEFDIVTYMCCSTCMLNKTMLSDVTVDDTQEKEKRKKKYLFKLKAFDITMSTYIS